MQTQTHTRELARAIADLLPGSWILEPARDGWDHPERFAYIVRADGVRVFVGTDRGRVFFSPDLPGRDGRACGLARDYSDKPAPRITADPTRGAAAVARDVARRFLPDLEALWADVLRVRADIAAAAAARDTVAAALRAVGLEAPALTGGAFAEDAIQGGAYPLRYSVRPGGHVRVESFTLDGPAAPIVLGILKRYLVDAPAERRALADAAAAAAADLEAGAPIRIARAAIEAAEADAAADERIGPRPDGWAQV